MIDLTSSFAKQMLAQREESGGASPSPTDTNYLFILLHFVPINPGLFIGQ